MKKTVIISVICLSLFISFPVLANCNNGNVQNNCNCINGNCTNLNAANSQACQCLSTTDNIIFRGTQVCYKTNSMDSNSNRSYCGNLFSQCGSNDCNCVPGANRNAGCFRANFVENNISYFCEENTTNQNCVNNQNRNCVNTNRTANQNLDGRIFINVESGGNVFINGNQIAKAEVDRNYLNLRAKGQGVYSRDLKKIPIGIIHMFGADSDKDGLPDAFERAVGTDPFNFNTDKDRYSDKTEIIAGFNPNGPGRLSFDWNIINKLKGKFLIQVEHEGELWYVSPSDGKRYFIGNEFDAMELVKAFKL